MTRDRRQMHGLAMMAMMMIIIKMMMMMMMMMMMTMLVYSHGHTKFNLWCLGHLGRKIWGTLTSLDRSKIDLLLGFKDWSNVEVMSLYNLFVHCGLSCDSYRWLHSDTNSFGG